MVSDKLHVIRLDGSVYKKFLKFQLGLQVKLTRKINQSETIDYILDEHNRVLSELKKLQKKKKKK